jgi:hypothetical protein
MRIQDAMDGIDEELSTVLGDRYDEKRVDTLLGQLEESLEVEDFIKQVMQEKVSEDGMFSLIFKAKITLTQPSPK